MSQVLHVRACAQNICLHLKSQSVNVRGSAHTGRGCCMACVCMCTHYVVLAHVLEVIVCVVPVPVCGQHWCI